MHTLSPSLHVPAALLFCRSHTPMGLLTFQILLTAYYTASHQKHCLQPLLNYMSCQLFHIMTFICHSHFSANTCRSRSFNLSSCLQCFTLSSRLINSQITIPCCTCTTVPNVFHNSQLFHVLFSIPSLLGCYVTILPQESSKRFSRVHYILPRLSHVVLHGQG